jgi:D-alanine-D-alanine ligase
MVNRLLDYFLELAYKNHDKLQIVLVCNVDGLTIDADNYAEDSITSEYLTLNQYNKILSSIRQQGFDVISYFDEDQFIADVINGNCMNTSKRDLLVLNSAQKGTKIGRKSLVPSFCDLHHIFYNNSNAYTVSLCRDKYRSGCLLDYFKIPTPKSWLYKYNNGWLLNEHPFVNATVIAKLNFETSSIGLDEKNIFSYSEDKENFIRNLSQKYKQDVIVQEFIHGYEVETTFISSVQNYVLPPMGIQWSESKKMLGDTILNYTARKNHPYEFYDFSKEKPELFEKIQKLTLDIKDILDITGIGRVDFRITPDNQLYVTDVATNPGYSIYSSTYKVFELLGYSFEEMISIFIGSSLANYLKS